MHGRKLPPITAPARIMQVIVASTDADRDVERRCLLALLGTEHGIAADARYFRSVIGDVHLIWERHTEFSSYLLIREGEYQQPFDQSCFDVLSQDFFDALPGQVVRATQLALARDGGRSAAEALFAKDDLVHCELMDGKAALWADFHLHQDGFGRLLIVDYGMTAGEAALTVQRVQELGNYRNLALLGLPVAQQLSGEVTELERRLSATTQQISSASVSDDALLHTVSSLSAEVGRLAATTHYRMSASRAYAEMVDDRLRGLRIKRVSGYQSLDDFTERRLLPAVRTCISFSSRLDALSQRVAWTSSLLRTRVDTELSTQNRDLLLSMNRRTALQLRLQQTVEGLSVVAISYYAVGLLGHVLDGLDPGPTVSRTAILAVMVPIVFLAACLGLRWLHGSAARLAPIEGRSKPED